MKNIWLICLVFITTRNYAQDTVVQRTIVDSKVSYTEVISVDSTSKDELYSRAKNWIQHTYVRPKDVIQVDEKENGKLMCTGYFAINFGGKTPLIRHTLEIDVKDNKYRYIITNLFYTDDNGNFTVENYPATWLSKGVFFKRLDSKINVFVPGLKTAMITKSSDNW